PDPVRGKPGGRAIAGGRDRVDPAGASAYRDGLARFNEALDRKIAEWQKLAAPLRGLKFVSYHQDLVYLAERYGLQQVGTIEVKPGIPPTPGHLEELLAAMQREKVKGIIRETSSD